MSQPKRHRKRVKMVLPIRVWGTDAAGKPFVCLAHTLDVTPNGARIGGFTAAVKVGERIGITRGMKKAHFRVAWIGQPNTPTEEQIGVELLDSERDIWGLQLPAAEPDDCQNSRLRSKSGTSSAPVPAANPSELPHYLRELSQHLQQVQTLVEQTSLPSAAVEEFFSAASQVRNTGHVIERLLKERPASGDNSALLVLLNTQRAQAACSICAALAKDFPAVRSLLPKHLLQELVQNVGNLFAQAAGFEVVDAEQGGEEDNSESGSAEEAWLSEAAAPNAEDQDPELTAIATPE